MNRSLKNRLTVSLALVLAVSGFASYLILQVAIAPAFSTLEATDARTDLDRAELAIESQLQQLKAIVGDWAPWDEPYAFAQGKNPDFIWRNVDLGTLLNIEIELLQFFDLDGERLWSGYLDGGDFADIGGLGRLGPGDPLYAQLTGHADVYSVVSGLIMTARGPMLLVSLPLVEEAGKGPIEGSVVMGRILTGERLRHLSDHVRVPFHIVPAEEAGKSMPSLMHELRESAPHAAVHIVEGRHVVSSRLLTDMSGTPLGLLQSRTARDVTAIGQSAANLALLLFVVMAVVLVSLIWFLLRRDIVNPLERLAAHMAGIRRSGDLSTHIEADRDDEIGRLGHEFNELTGELQQVRRELVEQSFKAGKADTAAEVMHNIRNAMTPVVNAAEAVAGGLDEMSALRLRQAADELSDPLCPAERRAGLLRYLAAAADRLAESRAEAAQDVDLICRQARLIEEILSIQEKVAQVAPVQESIDLAEAVSEAAAILPRQGPADVELRIGEGLRGLDVTANRVQLLQVIGNVVLNAYEAVVRADGDPARIDIDAARVVGTPERVRLSVSDNGIGLDANELTQVFQRGYTSKTSPQCGLGLHWCANTLKAAGGSMRIESAGIGAGATVHIELPASPARAAASRARPAAPRETTRCAPVERSPRCPVPGH